MSALRIFHKRSDLFSSISPANPLPERIRQEISRLEWIFEHYAIVFDMVSLDEMIKSAASLDPEERASLAAQLLHSLDRSPYYVTDEEVARRMQEAKEDPGVMMSTEELQAGLKRRGSQVS